MIKAQIVADSLSPQGDRLVSVLCTFPRIILAEVNTHRMLCLAGDSMIEFDLPTAATGSTNFKSYKMSIKEFVSKWHNGAKLRKRHQTIAEFPDESFTAKRISKLSGKHVSNIRTLCRSGVIKIQNPLKKRSDDYIINGLDYNEYHNGFESKGHNIKSRLKEMKIRILNEETNRIVHSTVKDCFISGEKEVYKVSLSDGKTIKCSINHRLLTNEGWKPLKDITVGQDIIVQSFGTQDTEKLDNKRLNCINGKWVNQWIREITPIVKKRQNNKCINCSNKIIDIHHIIPVYKNQDLAFDEDNVEGLCENCHYNKHSIQDWQVSQYLYGKSVSIKSISFIGIEQTYDLEINGEYPNFIANGIVVHNSKNTSSSRAIPFKQMLEAVESNPFIPIAFQKEHKGMQGSEYLDSVGQDIAKQHWINAKQDAIQRAKYLTDNKVTKQLANRLLEPFMWTTMLITGSIEGGWDNFFKLRCPQYFGVIDDNTTGWFNSSKELLNAVHESELSKYDNYTELDWLKINKGGAEIHIMSLAEKIYDTFHESTPKQLQAGEWHIPFGDQMEVPAILELIGLNDNPISNNEYMEAAVKVSTAMAARTSYTVVGNEKEVNYENMIGLHDRLINQHPPHSSPMEHCAKAMNDKVYYSVNTLKNGERGWCRNYKGFIPYRHIIETTNN